MVAVIHGVVGLVFVGGLDEPLPGAQSGARSTCRGLDEPRSMPPATSSTRRARARAAGPHSDAGAATTPTTGVPGAPRHLDQNEEGSCPRAAPPCEVDRF